MSSIFNVSQSDLGAIKAWVDAAIENPDTYTANSSTLADAVSGASLTLVPPAAQE